MDAIRNWLHTYSELSDAEWTQFKGHLYSEHLKKRMCFVMADDVMESVAFVTKGYLQAEYDDGSGELRTLYFNTPTWNPVVADLHSLINGNKARFTISALTDCELITLKATTLQRLYDEHKSFERLGRRLAEHQYLQAMDRILNSEAEAPERYKKLVAEHPDACEGGRCEVPSELSRGDRKHAEQDQAGDGATSSESLVLGQGIRLLGGNTFASNKMMNEYATLDPSPTL